MAWPEARLLRLSLMVCLTSLALCLPARAELEISAYGGPQWENPNTIRSPSLGNDRVSWNSEPFKIPTYWGLRAAWWPDQQRGFGLTFTHAKAFADDPAKYGYNELNFSHGLNYLTADIWHRFEPRNRVTPYVGAGVGVSIPHVEVEPIGLAPTARYQIGGPAVSLVVGATMPLSQNWSVFSEYMATYSEIRADLVTGDKLNTEFLTQAINIGVSWRF